MTYVAAYKIGRIAIREKYLPLGTLKRLTYPSRDGESPPDLLYQKIDDVYLLPWSEAEWIEAVHGKGCIRDDRVAPPMPSLGKLEPVKLREYQVDPVPEMVEFLKRRSGGILEAEGGTGKTVMALEIARRLGLSTLVLVHTSFLIDQWVERILTGDDKQKIAPLFPNAKVGRMQGSRRDSGHDHDFVVGTAQTVTMSTTPFTREFLSSFGLVITDEVHLYGSDVWREAICNFDARYRLGLSATPDRADKREYVFLSHIGPIALKVEGRSMAAEVYAYRYHKRYAFSQTNLPYGSNEVCLPKWVNTLADDEDRNEILTKLIWRAYKAGRRVITLSDRTEHCYVLRQLLIERGAKEEDLCVFISKTSKTPAGYQMAKSAQMIFATYQMAKSALDIPGLSCLVIATPKKDVRQAVWRITRFSEGKKTPLIIDILDDAPPVGGYVVVSITKGRLQRYKDLGYTVRITDVREHTD